MREEAKKSGGTVDKFSIAGALQETGALLELRGDDYFRARAYQTGARALLDLTADIGTLIKEQRLTEVKGIGRALAAQIEELYLTGRSSLLEKLRAELPPGIIELSQVPGLSLKKIGRLHEALGVSSVEELKAACEAHRVQEVPGFGPKSEEKILEGIRLHSERDQQMLLAEAFKIGEHLLAHMRDCPAVVEVELAGSLRRFEETASEIRLVGSSTKPEDALAHFLRFPLIMHEIDGDKASRQVKLANGIRAHFSAVRPAEYWARLHDETGSASHVEKMRSVAERKGFKLSPRGLTRVRGERKGKVTIGSEADIYRCLGMQYVAPELREDQGEVEDAMAGRIPADLVTAEDIRGMVHCHTLYSDGKNTVEEMALAAEAMGMKYLTITDHSPTASYAGGLKLDRLKAQWEEIERVQERVKIKLLRGTESDILADGSLDYPDHILEGFDIIIASIHSRHKMDEDQMTRRVTAAMRQKVFKLWGHPLGRLILKRPPFACRVEEILDVIAESRAAIEVNGDPQRLDMEPRWIREARRRGIKFVVSTDAHSTKGLKNLRFGVGTARRGGITRGEVLNTLSTEKFQEAVRPAV